MLSPCRQDVHAECVVLSRTTWLTVIFQSWICCRALAPVGSEDPVKKWRQEAGSWWLRTSCSPVLDAVLPQAPQTWGGSSVLSIRGGSRLPSGSPPSPGPPGQLAISGPLHNGRRVQGDRWQLCQLDSSSDLHTSPLGLGKRARGRRASPNRKSMAVAFTQDQLISFTEHRKYFISYLWISLLSQIVPDRMLFHLLKIWGLCPPLLETVLLPLSPEEL